MKKFVGGMVLSLICLAQGGGERAVRGAEDDKPAKPPEKGVMQQKLESCQKLLEALAVNDLPKASDKAQDLIILSQKAEWKVIPTPRYKELSNEFRAAAENVVEQAKNKNSDGAALAYLDISMLCFKCHKHVREVRMTRK